MVSRTGFLKKPIFYILLALFILWIVLFEFILPENRFLPKPGIILLTIPALFEDYHLLANFFTTVSAIYLPPLLAYLFLFLGRGRLFGETGAFSVLADFISKLTIFFPAVLFGIFLIFWFPHSFFIEYIFSFIVSIFWWIIEFRGAFQKKNQSYITAFKSFGADEKFINEHILWNDVKPQIFKHLSRFHLHLWGLILVFEFISNGYGLGEILRQALLFHDLSAMFLVTVIITIITGAGQLFLQAVEDKFIFWSGE